MIDSHSGAPMFVRHAGDAGREIIHICIFKSNIYYTVPFTAFVRIQLR